MSALPSPTVQALAAQHLPGLIAVQRACYGAAFVESEAVFARRLASPAQCSLVLAHGARVDAYLAAYDSVQGAVTPLHGDFEVAERPDTLYLHDLAVLPGQAGRGLARALLEPLWAQARARGLRRSALVAVQGSLGFWQRHGYAVAPLHAPAQQARLAGYGEGALYLTRALANG